ncbi:hypothetical protein GQX74_003947 [Glossina fuscipes]|nr:hypothetical protein GQX74_003947 [Glossina fuscipes]
MTVAATVVVIEDADPLVVALFPPATKLAKAAAAAAEVAELVAVAVAVIDTAVDGLITLIADESINGAGDREVVDDVADEKPDDVEAPEGEAIQAVVAARVVAVDKEDPAIDMVDVGVKPTVVLILLVWGGGGGGVGSARSASISGWGCGNKVGGLSTITAFVHTSKSHGPAKMNFFMGGCWCPCACICISSEGRRFKL